MFACGDCSKSPGTFRKADSLDSGVKHSNVRLFNAEAPATAPGLSGAVSSGGLTTAAGGSGAPVAGSESARLELTPGGAREPTNAALLLFGIKPGPLLALVEPTVLFLASTDTATKPVPFPPLLMLTGSRSPCDAEFLAIGVWDDATDDVAISKNADSQTMSQQRKPGACRDAGTEA